MRPGAFPRTLRGLVLLVSVAWGCSGPPRADQGRTVRELPVSAEAGALVLPNGLASVKFAVIGDSGRGWRPQHEVAQQMVAYRALFPFACVLMAGDNIYEGPASPEDYRRKFEEPYRQLIDEGVTFHAVLGNHDDPREVVYPRFNMKGDRYYTFRPESSPLARLAADVQIFALDSTNLDSEQIAWLTRELERSHARWKIVLLHHPLYTPGRYWLDARRFRWRLESILVGGGVDAVFSGHEHFFARSRLQRGIQYFISGGAGSLRRGDARADPAFARTFDDDFHFLLVEIERDAMHVQAITRTGRTVDAAILEKHTAATLRTQGRPVPR